MLARLMLAATVSLVALSTAASAQTGPAEATPSSPAESTPEADDDVVGDIVVTAQKRQESINRVGMSINAATGEQLQAIGVTDTSQLIKIIPGFRYNVTAYGSPIYTIRGVGYQESSLAAGPAVSVYVDEVPLPYSNQTIGAALDIERVEVLKGPQGTLFGGNSTGGAINYVAAKPTSELRAGGSLSYSRFDTFDFNGFVSGPLTSTLQARIAVRGVRAGDWQQSYTRDDTLGERDQLFGRILLNWTPTDRLRVSLNLNGWRDKSESIAPQIVLKDSAVGDPAALDPAFVAAPLAPERSRAADWDPGRSYRNNNRFYQAAGRIELDLSDSITLTSITSYQKFGRYQPVEVDGTAVQAFFVTNTGYIESFFQELRLGGEIGGRGHWLIGANYQRDKIFDNVLLELRQSSQRFLAQTARNQNTQDVDTKAIYANADFEITPTIKLNAGIRYTKADRDFEGCSRDTGDGTFAAGLGAGVPGQCVTFRADFTQGLVVSELNQDNISWRVGVDYEPTPGTLLYANVSKGYKAGSFPLLTIIAADQARPVTQEELLAYEAGFKLSLLDRKLQLNGAGFYYDYVNKQIRGATFIPPFGVLESLLNVPKSRVVGFELSAVARPIAGFTLSPAVSLTASKITDTFLTFNGPATIDQKGEPFPNTPKWSGNVDAEYRWSLSDRLRAFAGANVNFQSETDGGPAVGFEIDGYTLLDLRLGVEGDDGRWNASIWGRNVTDKYYWTSAVRGSDAVVRYAGLPATYGVTVGFRY